MKIFVIISIFFIVFWVTGYYVYIRVTQAFVDTFATSKIALVIYIFLILSFLIGKVIENVSIGFMSSSFIWIGGISLGFFIYALLFICFFDFIRLINIIIPFYPEFITADYKKTKLVLGIITLASISIIFLIGYINALKPKVNKIDISINKNIQSFDKLNVVAVSDIHLGTVVNKNKTQRLINTINSLNPDLVIFAGDIIDDNINVVKHYKLLELFNKIKSKYGVYSCMGNHEYLSNTYKELELLENNGINILKDTSILIDNKFYIIGRDDIEGKDINGFKRKSLEDLTENIDFSLPVILLDHQPYKLAETAEYNIDLHFSGHTHNGQLWPFNYITGLLFEEDWGYLKKKNTNYYISSGFGTAAVPIRFGNDSEIVNILIKNK